MGWTVFNKKIGGWKPKSGNSTVTTTKRAKPTKSINFLNYLESLWWNSVSCNALNNSWYWRKKKIINVIYKDLVFRVAKKTRVWPKKLPFFGNYHFVLEYFLMKITEKIYSLTKLFMRKLLQQLVIHFAVFVNQWTSRKQAFSIFKHVLWRVSNVTIIMNWDTSQLTGLTSQMT